MPVTDRHLTADERQGQDRALSESDKRYRAIADIAPVGIFRTDTAGDVTFVNERWCQLGGMTPEAAMGKGWLEAIHPDDRERVGTDWYGASNAIRMFEGEYRYVKSDGATTWCLVQCQPEYDQAGDIIGYVGALTDITERKRAEKDRLQSTQRLEDITDAASDWFWEMDADLRFTYISDRYEEVARIRADHFYGKRMDETYPRSVKKFPQNWKIYLEAVAARRDFRNFIHDDIRKDGLRRVISNTGK
ncbi:MAG: PAS domain S-box protein, partial [Alphaproteobacteria bacterium]